MQCASSMAKRPAELSQPSHGVFPRQAFGRKIEQAERALRRRAHHGALLVAGLRAVEHGGRNAHVGELRHLVLHERDERADHQHGAAERQRGKLVAERLAAAGGHDDGGVVPSIRLWMMRSCRGRNES
jgi:hypothetical protein